MSKSEAAKSENGEADQRRKDAAAADVAFIEALAKLLRENDLSEIEVEREFGDDDELKVRLSRGAPFAPPMAAPAGAAVAVAHPTPAQLAAAQQPAATETDDPEDHPGCVTSPMGGTVYLAAEPGAVPFVAVGDSVDAGQTLLIIEAMKTMNQIPSPKGGVVKRILVTNEQPIEYGAPLLILE